MSREIIHRWVIVVLTVLFLMGLICFAESLRYPRIARSAYWRNPHLLVRATAARLFATGGVPRKTIVAHAGRIGYADDLNIKLLYLPELPRDDKTIRDRVFGIIGKKWDSSDERLFWLVTPHSRGRITNDDTLVYEYKTGRLVLINN